MGQGQSTALKTTPAPPYTKRAGFVPRRVQDFGDGGAFPEIHIAQYPLDMGRAKGAKSESKFLPLTVGAHGDLAYDVIGEQNENARKIVYSTDKDLIPKVLRNKEERQKEIKAALEKVINVRLSAAQPNKKVRKASGSPPVAVMDSPPRLATVEDQQHWKIPACVSNSKNPKGYMIPLDKSLAADGSDIQEAPIYDNFAKLSDALRVAEQRAREAVAMRSKLKGAEKDDYAGEGKEAAGACETCCPRHKPDALYVAEQRAREGVAMRSKLKRAKKDDYEGEGKEAAGACETCCPRHKPVEFEKEAEEEYDPFDFDQFLREVKKGKKAMEKWVPRGKMKPCAVCSSI